MKNKIIQGVHLQFITNQWSKTNIPTQIEEVCKGGCRWIQLRLKEVSPEEWINTGTEARAICKKYGARLIINDHVEFALRLDADGVHLGKEDMDPGKARKLLGNDKIIGGTANQLKEVLNLYNKNVDYVGLGPFRYTKTKNNLAEILGNEGYSEIMKTLKEKETDLPVFAIGGIRNEDIQQLFETGIQGIAVSSFLSDSSRIKETTKEIIQTIKSNK
jgi:thiamine-phosphate pyrophosphorylase